MNKSKSKIAQAAEEQIGAGFSASVQKAPAAAAVPKASNIETDLRNYIGKTISLPMERLVLQDNVRKTIRTDTVGFGQLVESIRKEGMAQNLTGEVIEEGQRAAVISGQRRWLAAQKAGLARVYVRLVSFDNDGDRILQGLLENTLREDLNAVDMADAFLALIDAGWQLEPLATRCARSEQTLKKYLQIAAWPDLAKEFVRDHIDVFPVTVLFNQITAAEHEDNELLIAKLRNLQKRASEAKAVAKPTNPEVDSINQQRADLIKSLLGAKAAVSQKNPNKPIRVTLSFKDEDAFSDFTRRLGSD